MENAVPQLPEIDRDPIRIRQVLFNLLSNAFRHTPPGGKITLRGDSKNQGISLSVTDIGEGLEPDQLASVFYRFYRGDKSRSRETGGRAGAGDCQSHCRSSRRAGGSIMLGKWTG
jgi:two-component system, OmpR family, sensor histidine kinase BaeS